MATHLREQKAKKKIKLGGFLRKKVPYQPPTRRCRWPRPHAPPPALRTASRFLCTFSLVCSDGAAFRVQSARMVGTPRLSAGRCSALHPGPVGATCSRSPSSPSVPLPHPTAPPALLSALIPASRRPGTRPAAC